jgi:parvulin-like peptidyl-prolyl isomerase
MVRRESAGNERVRRLVTGLGSLLVLVTTTVRWIEGPPQAHAQTVARDGKGKVRRPSGAPTASRPPAGAHEKIAAVVNGETITREHLVRECVRRFAEEVLEAEVNKRLILDACKQHGIEITYRDIDVEIARMAGKFGLPPDKWLAMLESERNISPDQYRRDIVWPTLALRRLAADSLEVSDEEVERAYESEYGPMIQVRLISTRSAAKAQKLHAQAVAHPEHFDRLAKDHSEDENSAAARGLVPPIRKHVGDPQVEQAAFALREGQVSSILTTAGQYVILKCDRRIPPTQLHPKERERERERLREELADRKLRSEGSRLFKQLQSQAEIVNVYNDPAQRKNRPGVAALINNQPVTLVHLGEQCLLRHGIEVLDMEINRTLLNQALRRRSLRVSQADIQVEINQAAEAHGFLRDDGSADVDRWLKQITEQSKLSVELYVRDAVWPTAALKKLVNNQVEVTEEDLKKGFLANYGERVEVLAVVLSDQRTAHEVFDLARDNPTERFFGELAHQYSIEPVSKANYGQVPPIRQHGGQPLLEKEAFRLRPGELSGVLGVGDKYVILRCLGRTQPVVERLEDVRDELTRDIREKKLQIAMISEFDRLKESARVQNLFATQKSPIAPASYTAPSTRSN